MDACLSSVAPLEIGAQKNWDMTTTHNKLKKELPNVLSRTVWKASCVTF